MKQLRILAVLCSGLSALLSIPQSVASIISSSITDWETASTVQSVGDGTNHVSLYWTIADGSRGLGWVYGSLYTGDSDVAYATGVTDISQITDASVYSFTDYYAGPYCDADCDMDGVGDFLVWRNTATGFFGVLRIDDIYFADPDNPVNNATMLNGTWWFQTDGTGNFSAAPVPAALLLFGSGLLALAGLVGRNSVI
jgi:hypothetical protein